jgi:DNA-binding response OmpR family regulator
MSDEKYRVLILDDDYELGDLLKEYLQKTTRCTVTYITNETDFWEYIRQETYDILFLDYKLQDANGLDILTRMGQQGYTIPTVMMTGEGSENIAARAIQSGALDYLVKGEYSFSALPPLIQKAARLR